MRIHFELFDRPRVTVKKTSVSASNQGQGSGRETGTTISGGDALRRMATLPRYSTGSPQADRLSGGGYKAGTLVVAFGKSGTGKTQLAMQAVLCAARAGATSLFIDTEGGFRPERVGEMALARGWQEPELLKRIIYLRCDSAAEQSETVRRMAKRKETADCKLVAIDTLTRNFTLDLPGRANMPERQGALDAHLSEMARDAFLNGRAYLLTNRVTFGVGDKDVGIGGRTVAQLVHKSLRLERERGQVRMREEEGGGSCLMRMGESGIGA